MTSYLFTVRIFLHPGIIVEADKPILEIRELAKLLPEFTTHQRLHLTFRSVTDGSKLFAYSRIHYTQEVLCINNGLPPLVLTPELGEWMVLDLTRPHLYRSSARSIHPISRYFDLPTYVWKDTDLVWIVDDPSLPSLSTFANAPRISALQLDFYMAMINTVNHSYFSYERIVAIDDALGTLKDQTVTLAEWTHLLPKFLRDRELEYVSSICNKSPLEWLVQMVYRSNEYDRTVSEWFEAWNAFFKRVEDNEYETEMLRRYVL